MKDEEENLNEQMIKKSDDNNKFNEINAKKKNKMRIFIILIIILIILISFIIIIVLTNKDKNETPSPSPENSNLYFEPSSGLHTHTIIFMPGLTNTPEDFVDVLTKRISISKRNTTKIVILRSPLQKVTVLDGEKNYSWFDIYSFPINSSNTYNFTEVKSASKTLTQIIQEEVALLDGKYDKIIIGGHSQGAIVSMYTSYTQEYMLGGVISFSGFFPPQGEILPNKEKLNVYFAFGDDDHIISPIFFNETIKDIKGNEGFKLYIYPNHDHSVCNNETIDVGYFLDKIME
jgi:predicted esterase